jgi:ribonuclease P protein component
MRKHWIRKTWEYKKIYKEGIKKVGKRLVVYSLPRDDVTARFGITVTKRIGKAVVRNKIKRVLREVIINNFQEWNGGFDTVVVAKKVIVHSSFQEIEKELLGTLQNVATKKPLPPFPSKKSNEVI